MSNEVDLHAARYDPNSAVELAGVLGYGSPATEKMSSRLVDIQDQRKRSFAYAEN